MRNEGGESRGFGFVSFQTPDQGLHKLYCRIQLLITFRSVCRNAWYEWGVYWLQTAGG